MTICHTHPMHKWNAIFHLCIFYFVKDIIVDAYECVTVY